jgi:hypothetical protein
MVTLRALSYRSPSFAQFEFNRYAAFMDQSSQEIYEGEDVGGRAKDDDDDGGGRYARKEGTLRRAQRASRRLSLRIMGPLEGAGRSRAPSSLRQLTAAANRGFCLSLASVLRPLTLMQGEVAQAAPRGSPAAAAAAAVGRPTLFVGAGLPGGILEDELHEPSARDAPAAGAGAGAGGGGGGGGSRAGGRAAAGLLWFVARGQVRFTGCALHGWALHGVRA